MSVEEVLDPEKNPTLSSLSHAELLKLGSRVETEMKNRSAQLLKMVEDNLSSFETEQLEELQEKIEAELEERPEEDEGE